MTTDASEARRQTFQDTADGLRLRDSRDVTVHALRRLTALINGEPIVYAEHALAGGPAHLSGTIVVLTERRVIFAELTNAPVRQSDPEAGGTVKVRAWARRTLIELEAPASGNSDWAWSEDWDEPWPNRRTQMVLRYAGGTDLTLPLNADTALRSDLPRLLPLLLGVLLEG